MNKLLTTALAAAMCAGAALAQEQSPGTNLIIEDIFGNKTAFPTTEIMGVLFENAPEYKEAPVLLSAIYTTNKETGVYTIQFGTDQPDENGDPTDVGEKQISITLTSDASEDRYNAELTSGFYRPGNGTQKFTFDVTKSAIWDRIQEGSDGVVNYIITSGSVDVKKNGEDYTIRMEFATLYGETYNFIYEGPIKFDIGSSEFEPLDKDVEVEFTGAQGRYYGNWFYPYADDMTFQLYTGEFDEYGSQINGYWLNVDLYMPKSDDPANNTKIADGIYKVDTRPDAVHGSYFPYTFRAGFEIDFNGTPMSVGTYITNVEQSGRRFIAYLTDGTIEVSENGSKFDFNFTTSEGKTVKATYNSTPEVRNFYTAPTLERPYSTIENDVEFDFSVVESFVYYSDPDTIKEGLNSSTLIITDPNILTGANLRGDYLWFDFLSADNTLTDGTYYVNTDFESHSVLPGAIDYGGTPFFTWYSDLDSTDPDGVQQIVAAISGGSFTVATAENGDKTITLDLVSDNGKKITGSFTAPLIDITQPTNAPAIKIPARK